MASCRSQATPSAGQSGSEDTVVLDASEALFGFAKCTLREESESAREITLWSTDSDFILISVRVFDAQTVGTLPAVATFGTRVVDDENETMEILRNGASMGTLSLAEGEISGVLTLDSEEYDCSPLL